ncbi:hypothetical protein, variant [Aphanomyces astaci]|nr:hypothetical protein, variant [Aphanomyces astaci]ETV85361.1 hypothetical protein, variant [Aphanomyces astaci]|eukprot:XP_009825379.1 hypothetical protein, variant [Aphanomyces astaci]
MSLDMELRGVNVSTGSSFVLEYDVYVYGGGHAASAQHPSSSDYIFARRNQSVWLHCPDGQCGRTSLFDVSQDNEGLGGTGYGSYLLVIVYHGYYPHLFAQSVQYLFSYTAPVMHASELALRTMLVVATLVWLPYWTYHTFERSSSSSVRPIQTRVLWLGLVLLVYQNPIFMFAQWFQSVSDATRFASDMCEAVATASWRVTWLFLMDHPLNASTSWCVSKSLAFGLVQVATAASMCILRFPQLFAIGQHETLFILLGVMGIGLTWTWLLWLRSICRRTMATLNDKLLYMTSRDHQLSYRFLFLELVLVMLYVGGTSVGHVAMLLREWVVYGTAPFLQAAVSSFSTRVVPLEHELFVSMVVYMAMVAHLPPAASASSTARFYIEEAHAEASRQQQYPLASSHHHNHHFHTRQNDHEDISNVFCLETAEWLVQLAWQAYMDPLGNPSASGNGVQALETFGFDLIVHLRHELLDTQAIVCMHRTKKRLVVAFRGSVSKAHWKTNLRFHQVPLWIHSLQGFNRHSRRSTCNDRALRWASRVPVLNLALPRVHSGFWKAYAAVRSDLKETLRLLLDDHPDLTLYITGHSMGGALAVLAAYDCARQFNIAVCMYNFGGPRVGNPAFVRQYNRAVPNSHRVVLDGDLVAGIPRFWGLYQHVGTEIAVDEGGNLIVDPSFIERRLHQRSKTRVAVHGMLVYRSVLRKCFDNLQL